MRVMRAKLVRWIIRGFCACIVVLLAAAAGLLAVNSRDEPLLPAVVAIVNGDGMAAVAPEQNLYFSFIGLSSMDGDDPNAEGRRIVALYQQAIAGAAGSPPRRGDPGPSDVYALAGARVFGFGPELGRLCALRADPGAYRCIADAASMRIEWEKTLADNAARLGRYRRLAGPPRYQNVSGPGAAAAVPRYYELSIEKRLQQAAWALQVERGELAPVIGQLVEDTKFWRDFLALRSAPPIEKSIASTQVHGDLLFMSELLRTRQLTTAQYDALGASLYLATVAERSMAGALDAELRWDAAALALPREEDAGQNRFCDRFSPHRLLNDLSCAGFLRNATINHMYRNYRALAQFSEQPCEQFDSGYALAMEQLRRSPRDYFYNPTGAGEWEGAADAFSGFSAKFCNLEGIQRIVALQLAIHKNQIADAQIPAFLEQAGTDYADPFTGKPMQWDAQERSLAFHSRPVLTGELLRWPI